MIPKNRIPPHPGEILLKEFLEPMGLKQTVLAEHIGVPLQRINEIIRGKRGITPETAWLLGQAFGTTPDLWSNLQVTHDLARSRPKRKVSKIGARGAARRAAADAAPKERRPAKNVGKSKAPGARRRVEATT
jgi:addiction module HigA family antidote